MGRMPGELHGILQTDRKEGKTLPNKVVLNSSSTMWGWHGALGALRGAVLWLGLSKEASWQGWDRRYHGKGK